MGRAFANPAVAAPRRVRPARRARKAKQLELVGIADAPLMRARGTRGGRRPGAGRKRAPGVRESVPHRPRPKHLGRHPVLVTLRAQRGLPSFRHQLVNEMMRTILLRQRKRAYTGAFQVVEFTIQENHLHLVVEATGAVDADTIAPKDALRAGVSGLMIAFAKRLNAMLNRKGKVWGDRWHGRELASPSEVRGALVYVFRNSARHGMRFCGSTPTQELVDPLSSAQRFTGWKRPVFQIMDMEKPPPGEWPRARPRTWLMGKGWQLLGLLDPREARREGK